MGHLCIYVCVYIHNVYIHSSLQWLSHWFIFLFALIFICSSFIHLDRCHQIRSWNVCFFILFYLIKILMIIIMIYFDKSIIIIRRMYGLRNVTRTNSSRNLLARLNCNFVFPFQFFFPLRFLE